MKCKKHTSDLSSNLGVCASCLRERLLVLLAAQAQAQTQTQTQAHHRHPQARLTRLISHDYSTNSDHNPPPTLIFPHSVSPYVSRRERIFYSTPQLGPTFCGADSADAGSVKKRLNKFRIFAKLFRTRSDKFQSDPSAVQASHDSSLWFSAFLPASRRNKDRTPTTKRRYRPSDRGMSPVRTEDFGDECDQSPSGSGYVSEASPWWRRTPTAAPSARRSRRLGHAKSASGSGMALCLSPLVRASPNRRSNAAAAAAEVRAAVAKPHLSSAASFCKNRSRKIADFGRVNHNR